LTVLVAKYFYKSKEELLLLIYVTDPRLPSNEQILKLVKELRGGTVTWGFVGTAALLALMILIFSMGEGEGFLPEASEMDFQLNPQSPGFTKIISSIDTTIDLFDPDITLDMNLKHPELIGYGISEEFLRLDLKDNFLPRISAYCKKS
jgi:hypothetical protein